MKNRIIFGILVLICIQLSYSTTSIGDNQIFQSTDGTVAIIFDTSITMESIIIGESSVLMNELIIPDCPNKNYTINFTSSILSSNLNTYCQSSGGGGYIINNTPEVTKSDQLTVIDSITTLISNIFNYIDLDNENNIFKKLSEMTFFDSDSIDNTNIKLIDKVLSVLGISIILSIIIAVLIFGTEFNKNTITDLALKLFVWSISFIIITVITWFIWIIFN